ncbi:hypothetical protein Tco_0782740 [Tanacetum coccineum]
MAQENYVEVCSMQRPPLLEPNGFCFWKARFETYVKSKDIDLWQVIQNDDLYYEVEDSTTKLIKEHPDYSSKNHVRKFLRALPLKWRAKVTTIEEANDLATLPLDKLIGNLKVYEMVLDNDGITSKTTKEKVNGKDKDEEEAEEFNLMARNFQKFFRKGHFASECRKPKENKAFVGGAWSNSEDGDKPQNDATCLMAIGS